MTTQIRNELKTEALRSLRNYLATGLEGFRQKGIDRLRAMGIDTAKCQTTREEIEHLISHVNLYC